jgi:hypothetical protein
VRLPVPLRKPPLRLRRPVGLIVGLAAISLVLLGAAAFPGSDPAGGIAGARWQTMAGSAVVDQGRLVLAGEYSLGAEMQHVAGHGFGVLSLAVRSAHWKPQDGSTDSSFGFEVWEGQDGRCHSGIVLTGNGHLGILRAQPDAAGRCHGDPQVQVYVPVSNWESLRREALLRIRLEWTPQRIRLVAEGQGAQGEALAPAQPFAASQQFRLRLNAAPKERFVVDSVAYLPFAP